MLHKLCSPELTRMLSLAYFPSPLARRQNLPNPLPVAKGEVQWQGSMPMALVLASVSRVSPHLGSGLSHPKFVLPEPSPLPPSPSLSRPPLHRSLPSSPPGYSQCSLLLTSSPELVKTHLRDGFISSFPPKPAMSFRSDLLTAEA